MSHDVYTPDRTSQTAWPSLCDSTRLGWDCSFRLDEYWIMSSLDRHLIKDDLHGRNLGI